MALETWLLYLVAVTGLAFAPGPNGLLALSHGALYGRKKTLSTILGGVTGFVGVIAISMFGIGSLMMASANVLSLLKWLGGAYLIYLGIQLWRSPAISMEQTSAIDLGHTARFRQGLLAAIANPKVILFFGAFLPQFMTPEYSCLRSSLSWPQHSLLLNLVLNSLLLVSLTNYALGFRRVVNALIVVAERFSLY